MYRRRPKWVPCWRISRVGSVVLRRDPPKDYWNDEPQTYTGDVPRVPRTADGNPGRGTGGVRVPGGPPLRTQRVIACPRGYAGASLVGGGGGSGRSRKPGSRRFAAPAAGG